MINSIINIERFGTKKELVLSFTIGKWGGFDIGDGEHFFETLQELFNTNPDFFIKTEKIGDTYELTYIPNPFNKKDTCGWDDKEMIDLFKYAETYKVTENEIKEHLQTAKKFGVWEIDDSQKQIIVNDFFYYCAGGIPQQSIIKTTPLEHPKYNELMALYESINQFQTA